MIIMQGDAYYEGITVLNNAKVPVTPNDVIDLEITIGKLRKTYRNSQIIFKNGKWLFPLSQDETFDARPMATKSQIRILWANGVVEGKPIHGIRIGEGISKEVLK